jgi:hypothetical protein
MAPFPQRNSVIAGGNNAHRQASRSCLIIALPGNGERKVHLLYKWEWPYIKSAVIYEDTVASAHFRNFFFS